MPPTSVSSSNQTSQLNNLLGKMPSGNLGPFTVLPQEQKTSGSATLHQDMIKNFDGSSKPVSNIGANNNTTTTGPPRNLHSQTLNSSTENGTFSSGFPIPPSE